jgi:RNA polymerase sigma factor (sigma-70 family)
MQMAGMRSGAALHPALSLFDGRSVAGLSESELLERFASRRDEAAFAALVALHGPMVLATCRGVLRDPNDAEDAFQATFLVLVKKAGMLRVVDSLGGWLYRVAFRMALQANDDATRRRERERRAGEVAAMRRSVEEASDEVRPRLYAEIDRLPVRYRLPLVLCYLEGLTQDLAARRLGVSEGTLRRRLAQARERLRVRLNRGGASQTAGSVGLLLAGPRAAVPVAWAEAALRVAAFDAEGKSVPVAAAWAATMLRTMLLTRWRWTGTLALGLALVGAGLGLLVGSIRDDRQAGPPVPGRARVVAAAAASPALDGPLGPLGRRLYVSGTSWFADVAPKDHWRTLVIDTDQGAARKEQSVDARASIWRSADGTIVAWSGVGSPDGSLWARDARGQDLRLLDARDPESSCAGVLCAFAPDGKRVVAGTLGLREGRRVFTTWRMNIDGTAGVRLPLGESDMVADWSPDGERLLVVSEGRGPYGPQHIDRLSLATPDGRRTRLLMEGRMFIHPRFSPDGGRIAYVGNAPGDGRHGLIIIDVDGSNPRRVMDLGGMAVGRICWSPDGMRLALSRLTTQEEVAGPQASLVEVVHADGTDRRKLRLPVAFTEISELNWR